MIKAAMLKKDVKELKRIQDEIHIEVDHDVEKSLIKYDIHNESNNNNDSIAKYYQNKDNVNLSLTNETKFMSHYFWLRVHQLLTSSLKNNDSKYRIFQVQENDSLSKKSCINNQYTELDDVSGVVKTFVKESRFSYIRPIHDNLHYEGHIIRHLKDHYVIDNLAMGSVLLGDLEKVE